MSATEQIIDALTVLFELAGQEIKPATLLVLAGDLAPYGTERVLAGLNLCRVEYSGRITTAVLIEKIQQADGRPGVGEAWALAVAAADERNTVVWTPEAAQAWAAASTLYEFDKFGARKAFEEVYQRAVREAIRERRPVQWVPSIGWDADVRRQALTDAVGKGLLNHDAVAGLLPAPAASGVGPAVAGLLTGQRAELTDDEQRARLAEAKALITAGSAKRQATAALARAEFEARRAAAVERATSHPLAGGGRG